MDDKEKAISTAFLREPQFWAFFVLGAILLLLGVANSLNVPWLNLLAADPSFRWVSIVLGLLFVAAAPGISWLLRRDRPDDGASLRVHKYSGRWAVKADFTKYRGKPIGGTNSVHFDGLTLLTIPPSGEGGSGVQIGKLFIEFNRFHGTYAVLNEIQRTALSADGKLELDLKVIRREILEEGPPVPADANASDDYAPFRRPLAIPTFHMTLEPDAGDANRLVGYHTHQPGVEPDQQADEKWEYSGIFAPPGL